jgi:hypothetical protein
MSTLERKESKMSELNLKLSDSYATGQAPFHDWEYKTFGNPQANQANTYLVLENTAGNEIEIWAEFDPYLEESTGNMVSRTSMEVKKLTIGIGGGIERTNLLEMLQLILNAEKIGAKLIP